MNGKVFLTGKTFGETCAYVCQELSQAQVLHAEGVRAYNPKVMAEDFEWQHALMPGKEKPVFYCALTFPLGERVEDAQLVEIGKEYMQKMGLSETQYAFVKHSDTRHLHIHIVANRVDNNGLPVGKGLIIERSIDVARELTRKYGLKESQGKRLDMTRIEALHAPDLKRYQVYQAIQEVIPRCRGMDDLEIELLAKGVTMRYRYDKETGVKQGVSFRWQDMSFKGSQVDKGCSLRKLQQRLAVQDLRRRVIDEGEHVNRMKVSLKPEVQEEKTFDELRIELKEQAERRKMRKQRLSPEEQGQTEKSKQKQVQELREDPQLRRGLRINF